MVHWIRTAVLCRMPVFSCPELARRPRWRLGFTEPDFPRTKPPCDVISSVFPKSQKMRCVNLSCMVRVSGREASWRADSRINRLFQKGPGNRLCTTMVYYHGLCTTMVYVLPWSMYYHGLSTTMVYVLPWPMYYHGLCTTMVYVLPWSMHFHGLCTTIVYVLPWSMYMAYVLTTVCVLPWSMYQGSSSSPSGGNISSKIEPK